MTNHKLQIISVNQCNLWTNAFFFSRFSRVSWALFFKKELP